MAQSEQDREDLLREATALAQRVELAIADRSENVVVGFRRNGAGCIYFGADLVLQLNTKDELRRAYQDGLLIKAWKRQLVELRRERTESEVLLRSRELSADEAHQLLERFRTELDHLRQAVEQNRFTLVGQYPSDVDVLRRVQQWLARIPSELTIARRPNAD